jgi:epoxyqueuosine reductase
VAERLLADLAPLVRGAAVWAIARLVPPARLRHLHRQHAVGEASPEVRAEWAAALQETRAA